MKIITILLLCVFALLGEELQVRADYFESDQKKGKSLFKGNVHIKKGYDELNASKVIIYTDAQQKPVKFIAEGDVSFVLKDENQNRYKGRAQKVIYEPNKKIYEFYTDVYLKQIGDTKEISGDEVILKLNTGKAYAKGVKNNPVIMKFNIEQKEKE